MNENEAIALLLRVGCSDSVITHCKTVSKYAKEIAHSICEKGESVDIELVFIGGLLHDIGRSKTHDINHAVIGAKIAYDNGCNEKIVKIIERHIGAGIPQDEALCLGLPVKDYFPISIEEKIVAHADNLVSGDRVTSLDTEVTKLRQKNTDEKIIKRIIELNNYICYLLGDRIFV